MAFESFKKINFLNRTASIGTSHKELYKKIPAALREGKKAAKRFAKKMGKKVRYGK